MKKNLLFIISLFFFTVSLSAQSFKLMDVADQDITGLNVGVPCLNTEQFITFNLNVLNTSSTAKTVKVKKIELNQVDGVNGLSICWKDCYAPFVNETPEPLVIEAGAVCREFKGDIDYVTGTTGIFKAKFVFFDVDNPSDTSFVIAEFYIGPLSLNENIVSSAKVSNAYPNPATSTVFIDYKLPSNVTNAKINISNLLGTIVDVVELTQLDGKAAINVSNLKNGVYFYSLLINNSATVTRKFVVNR